MAPKQANDEDTGSNTVTLIIGIALIPVFYGLYAYSTDLNIRCHVPSWDGGNKFYELVPYFFVLFLVLFMGSFAMRVVSDDTHISDSLLGSIMTFVAGIFAFALIYRAYGLEETTGYFTPVMAAEDRVVSMQIVDDQGHSLWAGQLSTLDDLYLSQPPEPRPQAPSGPVVVMPEDIALPAERRPLVVLEQHKQMVTTSWDYLFYSAANAIPGGKAYDYDVCPSASHFVILQNIFGLVMTIIIALLGNRLGEVRRQHPTGRG